MEAKMMSLYPLRLPKSARVCLLSAVMASASFLGPSAIAQVQPPAQAESPTQPAPNQSEPNDRSQPLASIPDQKLDAAATALQKVVQLKQDFQQRLDAAKDTDKQGIADEAKGALTKAVTDEGLSVEEYTAIMMIAQRDQTVREQLLRRLHQTD